jgi:hypothetical protein
LRKRIIISVFYNFYTLPGAILFLFAVICNFILRRFIMNNHVEAAAVRKVIDDYRNGTYNADAASLKGVFHEKAVMNGYLGPDLVLADPSAFIADIGGSPSMASNKDPYQAEIESIHIEGNVASVILSETGFRGQGVLVDFFHLIKTGGKWQIISKLFTTV